MSTVEKSAIVRTPGVCGGDARVYNHRIAVWLVILSRRRGRTDAGQLEDWPALTQADLDACWDYYREHPVEIEQSIWLNDTAGNVPAGTHPPTWVLVSGQLLQVPVEEICEAFDPPIRPEDVARAWATYREQPDKVNQDIAAGYTGVG